MIGAENAVFEITCPYCKKAFSLTEGLTQEISEKLSCHFEEKMRYKEEEMLKKKQELEMKAEEIKNLETSFNKRLEMQLEIERQNLKKDIKEKIEKEHENRIKSLQDDLNEQSHKLKESQNKELELIKERRVLEEEKNAMELKVARSIEEERRKIEELLINQINEKYHFQLAERDKMISDLRKQVEEAANKANQYSQQLKGEVLELELENRLKDIFTQDSIEPIKKGEKGADVIQKVYNNRGKFCGTIIWESKHAKKWDNKWLEKLYQDKYKANAEIGVLLTTVLPDKNSPSFFFEDGLWITDYNSFISLASALRIGLMQIDEIKVTQDNKDVKTQQLYSYLCSPQFQRNIENTMRILKSLKNNLDDEKKALTSLWKKREKEIEQAALSVATIYGELRGITGSSLPEIESLEIKSLPYVEVAD